MNAAKLQETLMASFRRNSLFEPDRHYLGMSGAGLCPRQWYWSTTDCEAGDLQTWFAWTGMMHEARVLELLGVEQRRRTLEPEIWGWHRRWINCQKENLQHGWTFSVW